MHPRNEANSLLTDEEIRRPLSPLQWQQVNKIICSWLNRSDQIARSARSCTRIIKESLEWLDPFFQRYVESSYYRIPAARRPISSLIEQICFICTPLQHQFHPHRHASKAAILAFI